MALALVACPALVPKATGSIPAMSFEHGDTDARTVSDLGRYFTEDDNATYSAESSDDAVATASATDTTLTVTPKGPGTATVTVTATASNGRDTATQSFAVTVAKQPDPPPNNAPEMRTINNVSLDVGESMPVDLSDYASDADAGDTLVYGAQSLNPAVATVTPSGLAIPGSVITITGVSGGEATIQVGVTDGKSAPVARTFVAVVTAPAPDNREPILLTSNLIPHVMYSDFRIGATKMYDLSMHFQDPDADTLMYGAESDNPMVASIDGLDAATGMFTLTAVGKGDTTVTVMATDPDGASGQQTFKVGVGSVAPMATTASTDVDLKIGGTTSRTFDLDDYFEDDLGEALTYALVSNSSEMHATAELPMDSSMLTITAVAAGEAIVTVSAADSDNDPVELAFMVMVHAADEDPPPDNNSPMSTSIGNMSLMVGGDPGTVDLSMHFTDADADDTLTYTHMSNVEAIARTSLSESTLTVTPGSAGTAMITVTASDGKAEASESFEVTVTEAPNMAPEYKAEKDLESLKIQIVDGGLSTEGADSVTAANTADNKRIDLSEYFEDPDGVLLFFTVTHEETPDDDDNKPVIELHGAPAVTEGTAVAASGDPPDGTTDDDTVLVIEPHNPGTATITVKVTDVDGDHYTDDFEVRVYRDGYNTGPSDAATASTIPNQVGDAGTDPERLKIGVARTVIDGDDIDEHFQDPNFNSGDELTISVEYYPAATDEAGAEAGTGKLDADDPEKVGVTSNLDSSPLTWRGDPDAKFTLTLTGRTGTPTAGIVVALIATDTFGERHARVFTVRVNNLPKAEGAQASASPPTKVLTLADASDELRFKDMGLDANGTDDNEEIILVATGGGGGGGGGGLLP